MSIEKAAEAIRRELIANDSEIFADKLAEKLARAALPHLLEEPQPGEVNRILDELGDNNGDYTPRELVAAFLARRRNAPPEPPEPVETHTVMLEHGLGCSVRDRARTTISHVTSLKLDGVDVLAKPAAPPVPDPRREAIWDVLAETDGMDVEMRITRLCSALDSLKGTK